MQDLTRRHPALQRHLYGDDGALRTFVNIFLNDDDVRHLQREGTPVASGDTLPIIPSIAGGAGILEKAREVDELPELSPADFRHYRRHLNLPDVGTAGQRRLKAANVLTNGAHGAGSPLGLHPAAAALGTLR